ncbi:MAG: hypothetical protein ACREP2_10890 [Rhodanobacteraceae bacterium]
MPKTKPANDAALTAAPAQPAPLPPSQAAIDRQAKLRAAAVLEVLAGERTPTKAAQALGVTLPRYYLMEAQALKGLVSACALKPRGRIKKPPDQTERLERENAHLRQLTARLQTLLRAAQRSVGLAPPTKPTAADLAGKRRKRKPTVRALRAAVRLQSEAQLPPTHPLNPTVPAPHQETPPHGPSARPLTPG